MSSIPIGSQVNLRYHGDRNWMVNSFDQWENTREGKGAPNVCSNSFTPIRMSCLTNIGIRRYVGFFEETIGPSNIIDFNLRAGGGGNLWCGKLVLTWTLANVVKVAFNK